MKKTTEWYYGISLKDRFKQRTYDAIMGRNMLTAELMLLIATIIAIFIDANSLKMISAGTWILLIVTIVINLMNEITLRHYRLHVIEADTPEEYRRYEWLAVVRGVLSAVLMGVFIFAFEMAYEAAMDMNPDRIRCQSLCLFVNPTAWHMARQEGLQEGCVRAKRLLVRR